jgi:hypothetical protein
MAGARDWGGQWPQAHNAMDPLQAKLFFGLSFFFLKIHIYLAFYIFSVLASFSKKTISELTYLSI